MGNYIPKILVIMLYVGTNGNVQSAYAVLFKEEDKRDLKKMESSVLCGFALKGILGLVEIYKYE